MKIAKDENSELVLDKTDINTESLKKVYNSRLRALLALRDNSDNLGNKYNKLLEIEKDINELNFGTTKLIEVNSAPEEISNWKSALNNYNDSVTFMNKALLSLKEKIAKNDRSDSSDLWKEFNLRLDQLKTASKNLQKMGCETLPKGNKENWENDICTYESALMPLVISYAEACQIELQVIEKYTPQEQKRIKQLICEHIPRDFTADEINEYRKDYLNALDDLRKEFKKEKNLWDSFLDILAGGVHQTPAEHVMMKRWLDGEKGDL